MRICPNLKHWPHTCSDFLDYCYWQSCLCNWNLKTIGILSYSIWLNAGNLYHSRQIFPLFQKDMQLYCACVSKPSLFFVKPYLCIICLSSPSEAYSSGIGVSWILPCTALVPDEATPTHTELGRFRASSIKSYNIARCMMRDYAFLVLITGWGSWNLNYNYGSHEWLSNR